MTEPRARPRRTNHAGASGGSTTFPATDLSDLLYAYASSPPHLPSTISVLDEILTDFIIETCHVAALSASYSRRQKMKVEDFKFALRHDERMLGRSMEHIWRDKRMKEERKVTGFDDGAGGGGATAGLEAAALEGGVGVSDLKGGKKRRKKRKRGDDEEGERDAKHVAS